MLSKGTKWSGYDHLLERTNCYHQSQWELYLQGQNLAQRYFLCARKIFLVLHQMKGWGKTRNPFQFRFDEILYQSRKTSRPSETKVLHVIYLLFRPVTGQGSLIQHSLLHTVLIDISHKFNTKCFIYSVLHKSLFPHNRRRLPSP